MVENFDCSSTLEILSPGPSHCKNVSGIQNIAKPIPQTRMGRCYSQCQPLHKLHCGQLAAGFLLGTVISHQAIPPVCVHTQAKIWPQSFQPPKSYKHVKNKLNTVKGQIHLGPFVTECSSVISKSKYEPFLPRCNLATHNESRTVKSPMIIRKIITVNCDLSWFNDKHNNPSMQTLKRA